MSRREFLPFGRPDFSDQEVAAVSRILYSGWVGMGPETIAFESELTQFLGAPEVVTVDSCTSALFLSLLVSGVGPEDEVICPSLTWCSTANAALYLGAKPVFCDIDPETLCLTPQTVRARLSPRTKAVMAVHFGGFAVDVKTLKEMLPPHVAVIEDAAHALGARFADGSPVGSSGNLTCFSFYANKNLSTGEGGAIALSDRAQADRLRSLRQHALPIDAWKRFTHPKAILLSNQLTELGYKMNYTDLHAAIGRVQLSRQGAFGKTRHEIAQIYRDGLEKLRPPLLFQKDCVHPNHALHLFVVQLPLEDLRLGRDEMVLALRARNIGASIHYAPLHTMPLYCGDAPPPILPVTEKTAKCTMTLPISSSMTAQDAKGVVECLKAVIDDSLAIGRAAVKAAPREEYGFHDRLSAKFPSQVIVDATEICNLACVHCPHPDFKKSEHYTGRHLDLDLHRKMVTEVREHGQGLTQYIRYTSNGEPLVHPGIYDMLDDAVQNSRVFVALTTNGTLLNEKRIEKLLASGLNLIDISLDALTPETYAAIRISGDLEVTRHNVLKLLEIKRRFKSTTRVVVSFVEQPNNTREATGFEAYWKDQGVDHVIIRRLHSAAGGVPGIAQQLRDEQGAVARRPCLYPWERILLNPRGELAFCPQDWSHGSVIADYHRTTIRETWNGEAYRRLRQAHLDNDFARHPFCGQCPDWRQTRWPGEGRSYADLVQECLSPS